MKRKSETPTRKKNAAAVELGRRGGKIGGRTRMEGMTAEQRRRFGSTAVLQRWAKNGAELWCIVLGKGVVRWTIMGLSADARKTIYQLRNKFPPGANVREAWIRPNTQLDAFHRLEQSLSLALGTTSIAQRLPGSVYAFGGAKIALVEMELVTAKLVDVQAKALIEARRRGRPPVK